MSNPVERMARALCRAHALSVLHIRPDRVDRFIDESWAGWREEAAAALACAREIASEAVPELFEDRLNNADAVRGHNACRAAMLNALTVERRDD